jgi:hypothetical protein
MFPVFCSNLFSLGANDFRIADDSPCGWRKYPPLAGVIATIENALETLVRGRHTSELRSKDAKRRPRGSFLVIEPFIIKYPLWYFRG